LHELFVKEKTYLANSSPKTIAFYRGSFKAYLRFVPACLPSKETILNFVAGMKEADMKPVTSNVYIRGLNSFFTWLFENHYIPENLKIKQLKAEFKVMTYLSDVQVRALLNYKPKGKAQTRVWTMAMVCLDTGIRIDECLTLQKSRVDLDNLLLTVRGKGNKERTIPFSIELRKVLFKYLKAHSHDLLFCTRDGYKLLYDNTRRDFKTLLDNLGIVCDGSWHILRRTFARNYVRFGGNLFFLQKSLGHTTLQVTRRYVELETEDLSAMHGKVSVLSRIR
jgi:integrase/recombinase XerD